MPGITAGSSLRGRIGVVTQTPDRHGALNRRYCPGLMCSLDLRLFMKDQHTRSPKQTQQRVASHGVNRWSLEFLGSSSIHGCMDGSWQLMNKCIDPPVSVSTCRLCVFAFLGLQSLVTAILCDMGTAVSVVLTCPWPRYNSRWSSAAIRHGCQWGRVYNHGERGAFWPWLVLQMAAF